MVNLMWRGVKSRAGGAELGGVTARLQAGWGVLRRFLAPVGITGSLVYIIATANYF